MKKAIDNHIPTRHVEIVAAGNTLESWEAGFDQGILGTQWRCPDWAAESAWKSGLTEGSDIRRGLQRGYSPSKPSKGKADKLVR